MIQLSCTQVPIVYQLRPVNSGTSDTNRITYRAAGDGQVSLNKFQYGNGNAKGAQGLIALGGKKYITVSGRTIGGSDLDRFIHLEPNNKAELYGNFTGAEGCIVENIVMEQGAVKIGPQRGWAFGDYVYSGSFTSKYNILRHCEIFGYADGADKSEYTEDTVTLGKDAHHNLIENCYIGEARHTSINQNSQSTHTNVIRNNKIENPEHTAVSLYGHISDNVFRQDHHLIENNTLKASGETTSPLGGLGNALQLGAKETIVRYNIVTEAGSINSNNSAIAGISVNAGSETPYVTDNRIYHNSIVKNQTAAIADLHFGGATDKGTNRYWNNFLYNDLITNTTLIRYWRDFSDGNDRWVGNIVGALGGSASQEIIEDSLKGSNSLANTIVTQTNPFDPEFTDWNGFSNQYDSALDSNTFVNYSGKDFHLKATSPYVDSAAPLTQIALSDSGSGTALKVDDARFFYGEADEFPSWMNVNNDWIAIGSDPNNITTASKVQIASINDATNTITLKQSISRSDGDYVWLWKDSDGTQVIQGNAPDVGAFELTAPSVSITSQTAGTITANYTGSDGSNGFVAVYDVGGVAGQGGGTGYYAQQIQIVPVVPDGTVSLDNIVSSLG